MPIIRRIAAALAGVFLCLACAHPVDVQALSPAPPTILVAKKLSRPLFIVLDPANVKAEYEAPRIEKISNMQTFVTRDLVKVMSEYFSEVKVVPSASAVPQGDPVVAVVKVDAFKQESVILSGTSYTVLVMTWSFALKTSNADDYLFSFAGIAKSKPSEPSWEAAVTAMLENALTGLLDAWAQSGTTEKLRSSATPS